MFITKIAKEVDETEVLSQERLIELENFTKLNCPELKFESYSELSAIGERGKARKFLMNHPLFKNAFQCRPLPISTAAVQLKNKTLTEIF